jgi:hypothetical protein
VAPPGEVFHARERAFWGLASASEICADRLTLASPQRGIVDVLTGGSAFETKKTILGSGATLKPVLRFLPFGPV